MKHQEQCPTNVSRDPVRRLIGTAGASESIRNRRHTRSAKLVELSLFGLLLAAGNNLSAQSNEIKVNGYSDIILFDQPVAYYRFEETSGSVAKNLGPKGGDATYSVGDEASPGAGGSPGAAAPMPGPRPPSFLGFDAGNNAATFDGSSTWVDTHTQFLQDLPSFSLEYWVAPGNRVADPTTFGTRIGIVGQNDAIEYGFIDQNNIQIWTPNGGSLNTAYSFPDKEWHHVATIASGTDIKTYYDGVLQSTTSASTTDYGTSTYNVHIGGGGVFDATGNWFTGGIDEVAIFDRAIPAERIAQHYQAGKTGAFSVPFILTPVANLYGFTIGVKDFGTHVADPNTIVLKFNGTQVTPTSITKTGGVTTVAYATKTLLPSGSANTTSMSIKDSTGTLYATDGSFVAPVYATLGAADALAASAVDKTKPGFKIKTYQTDGGAQLNTIQYAEEMLAGLNGPNVANLQDVTGVDSKGYFTWPGIINFDVTTTAADGHFNDPTYTDNNFPGIPGSPSTGIATENFTEEIFTALEFPTAGIYTLDVNSDDGFLLMSGATPLDTFSGVLAGEANYGRGAADSFMTLNVTQAGIYPFRLLYFQGGGGGDLEFIVQNADGSMALVNDATNSIKAYQWLPTSPPAYARTVVPALNATGVAPNSMVEVVLVDGASPIDKSTISLKLDGTAVTPSINKTGSVTTVTYKPASLFASASTHTATFAYTEGTTPISRSWQFSVVSYRATLDVVGGVAGLIQGPGGFTPDKGGHSGLAGDYAIDTTVAGGTWVNILDVGFLNAAAPKDQLSVAFWIKKYDIVAGSAFWGRLSKVTDGTDLRGFQAHVPWSDDNIYFDTMGCCDASLQRVNANINTFADYTAVGNDTFWTNWHHFVFTKKADQKNVYIDGKLFLNGSSTDPLLPNFNAMALLTDGVPGSDYMHGLIDDFAVYSTEVSAADAANLAKGSSPTNVTGLIAYWPFNDASSASTSGQPAELGQTLNGYQDDFSGASRDPNWVAVGPGGDHYVQQDGLLQVSVSQGDPNHLIYMGPGGSNTTQEVLARLRVVNFGSGDPSRAGIGVCVSTGVTSHVTDWIGVNLNIRNNSENFNNGPSTAYHFKMLDDLRGWGPQTSYPWTNNVWYWMRLKMDPSKPDGTNVVFAKTWKADGTTPEPADWDIKWATPPTPMHGGYAGLTGCSAGGLGQYEVSYVLIKSASLPSIKVNFAPAAPAAISPPYFTSITAATNNTSVAISWFGAGKLESSAAVTGPWQTITNAIPPLTVPLTGTKAAGPVGFYRLQQ